MLKTMPKINILAVLLASSIFLPANAYTVDEATHTLTVSPGADVASTTKDLRDALNYLVNRKDKNIRWTWRFSPGEYVLSLPIYSAGLENVDIISDPKQPAILKKDITWSSVQGEYLFYTRMSNDLLIRGFNFYGTTDFSKSAEAVWPDQGLYFGSSKNITVDNNKFYNFGDAAVRFTTNTRDSVLGVNSFNSKLINNYFNNVYQISTTSEDTSGRHGGSAHMLVQNNVFDNLRGSIKAASRTPGCEDIQYIGNNIRNSDHYGFEIASCSNVQIKGNTLSNIKEYPITIYTNVNAPKGFPWGDNTVVTGNIIKNSKNGIRFAPTPYPDGFTYAPKNLVIENNQLSNITTSTASTPAITITKGAVDAARITANQFENVSSKKYIETGSGSMNVALSGNKAEGAAYGPQPSLTALPAPATSTEALSLVGVSSARSADTKPTAPSELTAQYDDQKNVKLTWKDNADNETEQQIWISKDGVKYTLLTRLKPDITNYSHDLGGPVQDTVYYYTIRAINHQIASGFSKPVKLVFPKTGSAQ